MDCQIMPCCLYLIIIFFECANVFLRELYRIQPVFFKLFSLIFVSHGLRKISLDEEIKYVFFQCTFRAIHLLPLDAERLLLPEHSLSCIRAMFNKTDSKYGTRGRVINLVQRSQPQGVYLWCLDRRGWKGFYAVKRIGKISVM